MNLGRAFSLSVACFILLSAGFLASTSATHLPGGIGHAEDPPQLPAFSLEQGMWLQEKGGSMNQSIVRPGVEVDIKVTVRNRGAPFQGDLCFRVVSNVPDAGSNYLYRVTTSLNNTFDEKTFLIPFTPLPAPPSEAAQRVSAERSVTVTVNPPGATSQVCPNGTVSEAPPVGADADNSRTLGFVAGKYPDFALLPKFDGDTEFAAWCTNPAWTASGPRPTCIDVNASGRDNITYDASAMTYVWAHVVNRGTWNKSAAVPSATADAQDPYSLPDPNDNSETLPFLVNFTLYRWNGTGIEGAPVREVTYRSADVPDSLNPFMNVSAAEGAGFSMRGLAGQYLLVTEVDPIGRYLEHGSTVNQTGEHPNRVEERVITILAPDLVGAFEDFKGYTPDNKAVVGDELQIPLTITNQGDFKADRAGENKKINWTLELNPGREDARVIGSGQITSLGVGESSDHNVRFYLNPIDLPNAKAITPGIHTLRLTVDSATSSEPGVIGNHAEGNETNNVLTIPLHVRDNVAPNFHGWYFSRKVAENGIYNYSRSESIYFYFNVSDDDKAFRGPADNLTEYCRACVNVSLIQAGKPTIYEEAEPAKFANDDPGSWVFVIGRRDLPVGLYDIRIEARDPSGNVATPLELSNILRVWGYDPQVSLRGPPADVTNASNITVEFAKGREVQVVEFEFNITGLGYPNDATLPVDISKVNVTLVKGNGVANTEVLRDATCRPLSGTGADVEPQPNGQCPPLHEFNTSTLGWVKARIQLQNPRDGTLSLRATDNAEDDHYFNWSFVYRHEFPEFGRVSVPQSVSATADAAFAVNFTSSYNVSRVWANVWDTNGTLLANLTLAPPTGNVEDWTGYVSTGARTASGPGILTRAATYAVHFIAEDEVGAINKTANATFRVTDNGRPQISPTSGPLSSPAEETQNVEFLAEVIDETPVRVQLLITRDSLEIRRLEMTPGPNNTYTVNTSFNVPGVYGYQVYAVDSAGNVEITPLAGLTVEANTFPRVRLTPDLPRLGAGTGRFMQSNSPLRLTIEDANGVDLDSLRVFVNRQEERIFTVDPKVSDGGRKVVLAATYPKGAFPEGSTVNLTVFSADADGKSKIGGETFFLLVDDTDPDVALVAPLAGARPAEPREAERVDVTPDTEFAFEASDATGPVNSLVREIRVTVQRPGFAARSLTWRAEDDPNWASRTAGIRLTPQFLGADYYGAGEYWVNATAVDQAGNVGPEPGRAYLVNLVTRGPRVEVISDFLAASKGFVNATVVDASNVGVDSVRLIATSDTGIVKTGNLTRGDDAIWRGHLPAFPKGSRVEYYVVATDVLGLIGESDRANFTADNHAPLIESFQTNFPTPVVKGTLNLNWTIREADGDPVQVSLTAKADDARIAPVAIQLPQTADRATVNTQNLEDGGWTFILKADDGLGGVASQTLEVWVENNPTAVLEPKLSRTTLAPGETLVVTAIVQKLNAKVVLEYRLEGTERWETTPMLQVDGSAVYRAEVPVSKAGKYNLQIVTEYLDREGRTVVEETPLTALTVESGFGDVFAANRPLWIGIVLLTVAALGVGGYALTRRWK